MELTGGFEQPCHRFLASGPKGKCTEDFLVPNDEFFAVGLGCAKPDRLLRYEPNLRTARTWALAASTSRFRGAAVVTREPSRMEEA